MEKKFDEIDNDKTEEYGWRKRQKQENQINEKDKIRLQEIYELLQESELLKEMNVSSDINKEIAEYANGHWLEHKECGSMISVLFKHHENSCNYDCNGCNKLCWFSTCTACEKIMISSNNSNYQTCECGEFPPVYCDDCKYLFNKCGSCEELCCPDCFGDCIDINCGSCGNKYCDYCVNQERDRHGLSMDIAIGHCIICGANDLCKKCVKSPKDWKRLRIVSSDIECVCIKCFNKHKDIFKLL